MRWCFRKPCKCVCGGGLQSKRSYRERLLLYTFKKFPENEPIISKRKSVDGIKSICGVVCACDRVALAISPNISVQFSFFSCSSGLIIYFDTFELWIECIRFVCSANAWMSQSIKLKRKHNSLHKIHPMREHTRCDLPNKEINYLIEMKLMSVSLIETIIGIERELEIEREKKPIEKDANGGN